MDYYITSGLKLSTLNYYRDHRRTLYNLYLLVLNSHDDGSKIFKKLIFSWLKHQNNRLLLENLSQKRFKVDFSI